MKQLTAEFFASNRRRLIGAIGKPGIIVVPGNGQLQRSADTAFPFRQDSNLYYLTGVTEPCATLVIDTVHDTEWLMLPSRDELHTIFDGKVDISAIGRISGIEDIVSERDGWKRLRQLAESEFLSPQKPMIRIAEMYTNPHRKAVLDKLSRMAKKPIGDIRNQLVDLRMIKNNDELALISEAATVTYQTLDDIVSGLSDYGSEREIEVELNKQFALRGATGHAYSPIIASGINSCTLHYVANSAKMQKGDVLLFDVGAEVGGYAADISRTVVFDVAASSRQQELMHAVAEVQSEIIAFLKPNVTFKQLAEYSESVIARKLLQLQLTTDQYTQADIRKYFPHSISHFLGLDVHDVGDYSRPLQAGMVITVEPGIYVRDELIGVRIEDDVVITENGAEILGIALPALL